MDPHAFLRGGSRHEQGRQNPDPHCRPRTVVSTDQTEAPRPTVWPLPRGVGHAVSTRGSLTGCASHRAGGGLSLGATDHTLAGSLPLHLSFPICKEGCLGGWNEVMPRATCLPVSSEFFVLAMWLQVSILPIFSWGRGGVVIGILV